MPLIQKPLNSIFTFRRNSLARYIGSDGQPAIQQPNAPRFEHDLSGQRQGILLEQTSINLQIYSEQFDRTQAYTPIGVEAYVGSEADPDGGQRATRMIELSNENIHAIRSIVNVEAGHYYTLSIFAKEKDTSPKRYLSLYSNGYYFGGLSGATFDLATGEFVTHGNLVHARATPYVDGYYRVEVTFYTEVTDSAFFFVRTSPVLNDTFQEFVGDPTASVIIFGQQIERTIRATSYIKTEQTVVIREKDSFKRILGQEYYNDTGTWVIKADVRMPSSFIDQIFSPSDHIYIRGLEGNGVVIYTYDETMRRGYVSTGEFEIDPHDPLYEPTEVELLNNGVSIVEYFVYYPYVIPIEEINGFLQQGDFVLDYPANVFRPLLTEDYEEYLTEDGERLFSFVK